LRSLTRFARQRPERSFGAYLDVFLKYSVLADQFSTNTGELSAPASATAPGQQNNALAERLVQAQG
jgi:hypothetical protein